MSPGKAGKMSGVKGMRGMRGGWDTEYNPEPWPIYSALYQDGYSQLSSLDTQSSETQSLYHCHKMSEDGLWGGGGGKALQMCSVHFPGLMESLVGDELWLRFISHPSCPQK